MGGLIYKEFLYCYLIAVWVKATWVPLIVAIAGVVMPNAAVSDVNVPVLVHVPLTLLMALNVSPVTRVAAHALAAAFAAASAGTR